MWKKRLVPLILAAAMLGACGGCGDKTSDSKSANADDSKFIVGFDAAFPPYGYQSGIRGQGRQRHCVIR